MQTLSFFYCPRINRHLDLKTTIIRRKGRRKNEKEEQEQQREGEGSQSIKIE